MNKWLLLILGIVSILLLSYLSFKKNAPIIKEDLLKKADIIHQNPAFKDVYVKLKGEEFALTRELMLLGTVSSKEERVLASNLLHNIKGVTKVNNLLKVQTLKPIIKEVESVEVDNTPKEMLQEDKKVKILTKEANKEKNSSSDANNTLITLKDKNISKETHENNTTELNATKQKLLDNNLTKENNESNQSSCQKQLRNLFIKNKIHFAHNSSEIEKKSYQKLRQVSTILKKCPNTFIVINGYSDNSGEEKYNQRLSQQRAKKVEAYLFSQGVNKKFVKAFGHGAKNPLASNETKEGREKNRRIEFTIKRIK